jgi:hypothetical protein
VLLAALAVVVVAGARTQLETIVITSPPLTTTSTTTATTTTIVSRGTSYAGPGATVDDEQSAPRVPQHVSTPTRHAASPTTTTTPTTTTSTTTTTTTTTQPPVRSTGPSSLSGTFVGGETTMVARLGAVRTVTVSVPVGMRVTLSVSCGISQRTATHTTTATVHIVDPVSTCVATIRVPPSSPEPAAWHLVMR